MNNGWQSINFDDALEDVTKHFEKIPTDGYCASGRYAIVDQSQEFIAGYTDRNLPSTLLKPPCIIFGDHTRIFKYVDFAFFIGADGVKVIKPKVEGDVKYFYYFLNSLAIENNGYSRHFKFLKRKQIIVPPLSEQKRIAAILDKADDIRRKREAAIAKLDQLAQSIFVEMFGHLQINEKKFPQQKLTEFFKFKTGKLDSNAAVVGGKYPFFTCSRENFWIDDYAFDEEALLLAGNNANADYSVKYYLGKFNAYQRTYVLNVYGKNSYTYAKACLELMLKEFKRASKGSSTKYLTMGIFDRMLIPVPPIALQEEFASRINKLEQLKANNIAALTKQNQLFATLQHQAFTGNL